VRMEERRVVYKVLVVNPQGKRPLGRPWYRWDGNINLDLEKMDCGGIDWIEMA